MKCLGEGTFGKVEAKGNYAIKHFNKLHHLIAEVFVTRYTGSEHIIELRRCNFAELTMTMDRWDASLAHVLNGSLSYSQKVKIHKCIVKALIELQSKYIVHCDIKPDNVLVDHTRTKAILADCGVSSISNRAKIQCTPKGFTHPNTVSHKSHDLFGLAIITLQIFTSCSIMEWKNKEQLREKIRRYMKDGKLAYATINLIKDDPLKCWDARKFMFYLYREDYSPICKKLIVHQSYDEELKLIVYNKIRELTKKYNTKRSRRCNDCAISLLTRLKPDNAQIELYVYAFVMIFAAVFGSASIRKEMVINDWGLNIEKMYACFSTIISCEDIVDLMFAP